MNFVRKISKTTLYLFSVFVAAAGVYYFVIVNNGNQQYKRFNDQAAEVWLRKFPFPYVAGLSICNDVDGTGSIDEFMEIQKFLHTKKDTLIGRGLGLEIGGSILFYERPETISWFNSSDSARGLFTALIRSGHIDFLHSYGRKDDFTRNDAIAALYELNKQNLFFDVWVDHTRSPDNFGDDGTFGQGDIPDSKAYHADLTIKYGIKFIWKNRVTQVVGQGVPVKVSNFMSIYDGDHPYHTAKNTLKEFSKQILAVFGNNKFEIHQDNDLVHPVTLDDGQKVYEFIRYDGTWSGVADYGDTIEGLPYVISKRNLSRLKEINGYMIVYTHLGYNDGIKNYFPQGAIVALRELAIENSAGEIYVTTTSRLLNYYINTKYLNWELEKQGDITNIIIKDINDPIRGKWKPSAHDLQGVTFYVSDSQKTQILIDNHTIVSLSRNHKDNSGKESITIPLVPLEFPPQLVEVDSNRLLGVNGSK